MAAQDISHDKLISLPSLTISVCFEVNDNPAKRTVWSPNAICIDKIPLRVEISVDFRALPDLGYDKYLSVYSTLQPNTWHTTNASWKNATLYTVVHILDPDSHLSICSKTTFEMVTHTAGKADLLSVGWKAFIPLNSPLYIHATRKKSLKLAIELTILDREAFVKSAADFARWGVVQPTSHGESVTARLLNDEDSADISLILDMTKEKNDEIIERNEEDKAIIRYVHSLLLSAASPVFKAMLSVDMAESNTKSINLSQFPGQLIEEGLLSFIYKGHIDNQLMTCHLEQLLAIADFYQMTKMKSYLEEYACRSFAMDNFACMIDLACKFDLEQLQSRLCEYMMKDPFPLRTRKDVQRAMRNSKTLASKLLAMLLYGYDT